MKNLEITQLTYSPGQAAQLLGCSRPFIYTLINDGEIKFFKVRARTFITRSELEAFVERCMQKIESE